MLLQPFFGWTYSLVAVLSFPCKWEYAYILLQWPTHWKSRYYCLIEYHSTTRIEGISWPHLWVYFLNVIICTSIHIFYHRQVVFELLLISCLSCSAQCTLEDLALISFAFEVQVQCLTQNQYSRPGIKQPLCNNKLLKLIKKI